jgi:PIN domain nuclease of toxin-antitoxin system
MKALLDTQAFIWWDSDPSKLSPRALGLVRNPLVSLFVSAASVWEILVKQQQGAVTLKVPLRELLHEQKTNGVQFLPVTPDLLLAADELMAPKGDPFDRLIAAQAKLEGALLVTSDPVFASYPVKVIW